MKTTKSILAALVLSAPMSFVATAGASGRPGAAGFGPVSVSFISTARGFVLGTSPCAHAPCTSVLTTGNGGASWSALTGVPAPVPNLAASQSAAGVSEITFANASDGWVFGPALWATTNGGASWHQEKLGGPVISLATAGGYAYATVGSCYQTSSTCSPSVRLERSAVQQDAWHPVPGISGHGTQVLWASRGPAVWLALWPASVGPASIWASATGTSWHRYPDPCFDRSQGIDLAGLAAPETNVLFELCAGNPGAGQETKSLRLSTNEGATSHLVSNLPLGGLAYGIAAANGKDVVVGRRLGCKYHLPLCEGRRHMGHQSLRRRGGRPFRPAVCHPCARRRSRRSPGPGRLHQPPAAEPRRWRDLVSEQAVTGGAKPVVTRLGASALAVTCLALVLAFLPGARPARFVVPAATTGPAVPVVACPSSYGAGAPAHRPVVPRTLRPGVAARVAKMLAYYTNDKRTLAPVLAPRGWQCEVQVGADGTTGVDVYPPGTSPTPSGTGHPEVQAASDSACQGCVYSSVCALVPGAGGQLGFSGLPCAPRGKGEVVTWLSGSPKDQPPLHDVIAFAEPGRDPTHGVVLYEYTAGRGGEASEETCTLPASQHPLCTAVLNTFVAHGWLMN